MDHRWLVADNRCRDFTGVSLRKLPHSGCNFKPIDFNVLSVVAL